MGRSFEFWVLLGLGCALLGFGLSALRGIVFAVVVAFAATVGLAWLLMQMLRPLGMAL